MRLIDADANITALIYDEEHEETNEVKMTIADFLDGHTEEGCPQGIGWISVKDRLPESAGLKVIVCAKTVQESVLQTKAVFVAFLGYGDGKWYTPEADFMASAKTMNDHVHPVWEITHWMFPPEPPKEAIE